MFRKKKKELNKPIDKNTVSYIMTEIYQRGIKPDWWKIDVPQDKDTWQNIIDTMQEHDQYCRGLILLGKQNNITNMQDLLSKSRRQHSKCVGFAIGRPIFWQVAKAWMNDRASDNDIIEQVSKNFTSLLDSFES